MSKLYLVPTPIGNLEDMTFRSIKILNSVDLILAEDTRKTGLLLKHFNIENKLASHHKFNEHKEVERIAHKILNGETVALVSDSGTPAISDPGFLLVRTCIGLNIPVECLPGPTAFVPALVLSGIPCDSFCFEGFLPPKKGRNKKLESLSLETRTMILYESPHRLLKTLVQLMEFLGADRQVAVIRELTKIFEETIRGSLEEIIISLEMKKIRGEFVIIVAGKDKSLLKTNKHETIPD